MMKKLSREKLSREKTWAYQTYIKTHPQNKTEFASVWKFIDKFQQGQTTVDLKDHHQKLALVYFIYRYDIDNLNTKNTLHHCDTCNRDGYMLGYCQNCLTKSLTSGFDRWTSKNNAIDQIIQNAQKRCPLPRNIIEYVDWSDLNNVSESSATWALGYITSFDPNINQFIRNPNLKIVLHKVTEDYIKGNYVSSSLLIYHMSTNY
jgi:hypothetical protein